MGSVSPLTGRAAAVQPSVGFRAGVQATQGSCKAIGSDSGARFLATFDSREAAVPEPNVHFCLRESSPRFSSSAHLPFRSRGFHLLVQQLWLCGMLEKTGVFDLRAVPYLPEFWLYSDASNAILFSSCNRGQGPVVLDIVKMPCKRL